MTAPMNEQAIAHLNCVRKVSDILEEYDLTHERAMNTSNILGELQVFITGWHKW